MGLELPNDPPLPGQWCSIPPKVRAKALEYLQNIGITPRDIYLSKSEVSFDNTTQAAEQLELLAMNHDGSITILQAVVYYGEVVITNCLHNPSPFRESIHEIYKSGYSAGAIGPTGYTGKGNIVGPSSDIGPWHQVNADYTELDEAINKIKKDKENGRSNRT